MIPFIAAAALKLSPVTRILKSIPRWAWIALAVVALLALGTCQHRKAVKKFGNERYAAGVAYEAKRIETKAKKLQANAEMISSKLKELNNVENRRIAGAADTLRLSGPGKAACFSPAATGPGRRQPPAGQASPAVDPVPGGEGQQLIGMPFAGTVALAEEHDLCLAEAATWREWHKQLVADWEKER